MMDSGSKKERKQKSSGTYRQFHFSPEPNWNKMWPISIWPEEWMFHQMRQEKRKECREKTYCQKVASSLSRNCAMPLPGLAEERIQTPSSPTSRSSETNESVIRMSEAEFFFSSFASSSSVDSSSASAMRLERRKFSYEPTLVSDCQSTLSQDRAAAAWCTLQATSCITGGMRIFKAPFMSLLNILPLLPLIPTLHVQQQHLPLMRLDETWQKPDLLKTEGGGGKKKTQNSLHTVLVRPVASTDIWVSKGSVGISLGRFRSAVAFGLEKEGDGNGAKSVEEDEEKEKGETAEEDDETENEPEAKDGTDDDPSSGRKLSTLLSSPSCALGRARKATPLHHVFTERQTVIDFLAQLSSSSLVISFTCFSCAVFNFHQPSWWCSSLCDGYRKCCVISKLHLNRSQKKEEWSRSEEESESGWSRKRNNKNLTRVE